MSLSLRSLATLAILACGIGVIDPAHAGTTSRAFTVSGYLGTACTAATSGDLYFGRITTASPTTQAYSAGVTVTVRCTNTLQAFGLWSPVSANGTGTQRAMVNQTDGSKLNYTLYSNSTTGTVMPTAYNNSAFIAGGVGNSNQYVSITAVIAAGSAFTSGHYEDNIVISVEF